VEERRVGADKDQSGEPLPDGQVDCARCAWRQGHSLRCGLARALLKRAPAGSNPRPAAWRISQTVHPNQAPTTRVPGSAPNVVACYDMLTVPEAAARAGRDPETIRRWIRSGKLRASKVGTQHVIEEADLADVLGEVSLPVPQQWKKFSSGRPQPDWVAALARSRAGR
jgi:excisionase family DNA binding protein